MTMERVLDTMRPSHVRQYCQTNRRVLALGGLLLASFLFCYLGVLISLVNQWRSNDMYSYGFLIPWISVYLIWVQRDKLIHLELSPNYIGGFFVTLGGMAMFITGKLGGITLLPELSLILTIIGMVLFLLGMRFLKFLWFPIIYLLFMIPMWEIITDRLHYPFQIFSATLGVKLLQWIGIPVHQESHYVMLPNITLEVAKVCSGVNYLIAVVAIGIPLAYLFLRGWLRRFLLVFWGVLIAVFGNGVRVALIGLFSYYGIGNNIHGPLHIFQGLSVAVVGYGALYSGLWVLTKNQTDLSQSNMTQNTNRLEQSIVQKDKLNRTTYSRNFNFLLCSLLLVSSKLFLSVYYPEPVGLKNNLNTFPLEIGEWTGRDVPPEYKGFQEWVVDHKLSRIYRKGTGETLWLYIGYFNDQNQKKKLVSYKTQDLYLNASKIKIGLDSHDFIEISRKVMMNDEEQRKLILFWFDLNGRNVSNPYMAKLYTTWDAITKRKTNGALIMLTSNINRQEDSQIIFSQAEEFIKEMVPLLQNYLPKD